MQFIDLKAQQQRIRQNLDERIRTVLDHGQYIMGPEVAELERVLAAYVGVKHAIGCASGTDALLMALMAYQIGPGDAVFTTPFTFVATAEMIQLLGATPVFVDIDSGTFNIDSVLLEKTIMALRHGEREACPLPAAHGSALTPKGIVAVDLFGLPADYSAINRIARENDLFVIEDAAQAFGADYKQKKACALADIGCTSFFPAKPLGGYGDGGMCFTDDDRLADLMQSIRIHGKGNDKYDNIRIGINGRLDTLQAAILLSKFDIFPEEVRLRNEVADRYSTLLSETDALVYPQVPLDYRSVWAQYSILAETTETRHILRKTLDIKNIPTAMYYPTPLHLQTAFGTLGYKKGDFPVSERCAQTIFSLPMHPYLDKSDQKAICSIMQTAMR